jgi:hypothetical protein
MRHPKLMDSGIGPGRSVGGGDLAPPTGQPVTDATLRAAGYLLVTDYGAVADGVTDSTSYIQNAINAANTQFKPLWFSIDPTGAQRPYIITKTLLSYRHFGTAALSIQQTAFIGASIDPVSGLPARPKLKIAANTAWFGNANSYEPMLAVRTFTDNGVGSTWPGDSTFDPLTTPAGWFEDTSNHGFGGCIIGIDFDTNQNPGGCGPMYIGAQSAHMQDIAVTATNSFAGTIGLPTEGSSVVNLKVTGGQYGVFGKFLRGLGGNPAYVSGINDAHISGLTCIGQTVACLSTGGFMSSSVCGFDLQPAAGGKVIEFQANPRPGDNGIVLVDGKVTIPTSTDYAFVNTSNPFCNINLHNVWVTGTTHITTVGGGVGNNDVGGQPTDWCQIVDYHLATNATVFDGTYSFATKSIIYSGGSNNSANASVHAQATPSYEHLLNIVPAAGTPPSDIVSRHGFTMPQIDTSTYIDITSGPYNCVAATTTAAQLRGYNARNDATAPDCRAGLQAAIDAAQSGNGRVFLPRGSWCIGSPGIILRSNTVLFGVGQSLSQVMPHINWVPTTGNPPVVDTVSDTEATTQIVNLMILRPQTRGTTTSYTGRAGVAHTVLTGNRFNGLNWKVGRKSICSNIYMENDYQSNGYASVPKQMLAITGTGGGRFYSNAMREEDATNQDTDMICILISGTSQPIWMYDVNVEFGDKGNSTGPPPWTNILVQNASNVRLFQTKREGAAPTLMVINSNNIAHYASGKLGGGVDTGVPANFYPGSVYATGSVDSASTNVMFASWTVFTGSAATQKLVYDQASGLSVDNQTQICLYLKGAIDDSVMGH